MVAWLAEQLMARGRAVAILGHGYRGGVDQPTRVDCPDPRRFGDEAVELFTRLPNVPVWVGPDRGATLAAMPTDRCVLVDGGLLDPRLPRRHTLLVLDATASTAVLPAGPLRAPIGAVQADFTWLHRADEAAFAGPADVRSAVRLDAILTPDGRRLPPAWLQGRALRVLCGVARPGSFIRLLEAHGARIVEQRIRADHAWFGRRDRAALGPQWIVTAKDRARLPSDAPGLTALISLEILAGDPHPILSAACAP